MVLAETGWSRTGLLPMITKQQYRKLMSEYQQTGNVTVSAMKADVSRPTARKYLDAVQPTNELQAKHTWRTREDSLVEIWPQAVVMLEEAPDLEAKALFEYLWERSPWAVQEKHLRTFQRRVKLWPNLLSAHPATGVQGCSSMHSPPQASAAPHHSGFHFFGI